MARASSIGDWAGAGRAARSSTRRARATRMMGQSTVGPRRCPRRGLTSPRRCPIRREMAAALEGLRVLDLATFVAAPVCATLLGEFGAEVIKVEQPGVGDDLRRLGRRTDGVSLWWLSDARNKE